MTSTDGGRSRVATSLWTPPNVQPKLSDSTPTITPVPSTPRVVRATSARIDLSPWLFTKPAFVIMYAGRANCSVVIVSSAGIASIGSCAETSRRAMATLMAPAALSSAARSAGSPTALASIVTHPPATGIAGSGATSGARAASAACSTWRVARSCAILVAGLSPWAAAWTTTPSTAARRTDATIERFTFPASRGRRDPRRR